MAIGRVPGATGIQPSIVDAKGDLIAATAADSVSRLAVGANNTVLTADSAEATGLKWAAVSTTDISCRAYATTGTALSTTYASIDFQAENFDTDTMHVTGAGDSTKITFKTAGKYIIGGGITSGVNQSMTIRLLVNSTTELIETNAGNGGNDSRGAVALYNAAVNDFVQLQVKIGSGTGTSGTGTSNSFFAIKVA